MGNVLEFYLKMKDMMSSGLVGVAKTAKQSFAQIESGAKKVQQVSGAAFKGMANNMKGAVNESKFLKFSINELKQKLHEVNQVKFGTVLKSEFRQAANEAKKLESQIARMENRGSGKRGFGGSLLGKAAGFIAPIAIAGSLMSFGASSVKAAMQFDAQKTSFGVLTGNRSTGNDLANGLRQLKQDTIMGPSVYQNAQTMLGFGIASNKVIPDLKMLGDVSMGDADKLKRLTLAFSEVTAAGQLNGRRMLQFVNAGFNPLLEMSRTTGKSMEELSHMMKKGQISAAMLENAFKSATGTGGRFNNMLNTMAETPLGKMKRLQGQWAAFKIDIGEALMPTVTSFMEAGSSILKFLDIHRTVPQELSYEQSSINTLVKRITSLNEGNKTRIDLLQQLKNTYPDLFGQLDTEKTSNEKLLKVLNDINIAYGDKIKLAATSLSLDNKMVAQKTDYQYADQIAIAIQQLRSGDREGAAITMRDANGGALMNAFTPRDRKFRDNYTDSANVAVLLKAESRYRGYGDSYNENIDILKGNKHVLEVQKMQQDNAALIRQADHWVSMHHKFKRGSQDPNQLLLADVFSKTNQGIATESDYNSLRTMMGLKVTAKDIVRTKDGDGSTGNDKASRSVGSSITSGGPKTINVHIGKFFDNLNINSASVNESMDKIEEKVTEVFLKVLNSGNTVK